MMKSIPKICCAPAFVVLLAGCGGSTFIGDGSGHSIVLRDNVLTAHAKGLPDAVVDASGNLSIGGKPVAITPEQRAQFKAWHDEMVGVRTAGIETGKAGAAMAAHAIGAVASGLAHGNPDSIEPKIDARAKDLEIQALEICDRLDAMQATPQRLGAELPVFKPYAALDVGAGPDCRKDVKHNDTRT